MPRVIQSIRDAEIAIKQLQDRLAYYDSQQWDLGRRNIKNVHPSVDEYDVVVRKELRDLRGGGTTTEVEGSTAVSGIPNFTFSIYGTVPEQTDITPPCLFNATGFRLKPVLVYGRCLTAPAGDFLAEIYHNDHPTGTQTQILNSQFTILDGELYATQNDINTAVIFEHLDWMSLNTKQSIGMADLEIVVAMRFL